jgi:hypothetical protein
LARAPLPTTAETFLGEPGRGIFFDVFSIETARIKQAIVLTEITFL